MGISRRVKLLPVILALAPAAAPIAFALAPEARALPAAERTQESRPAVAPRADPPAAPPVEWLPWSDEVFARARKEQRGVLLTVVSNGCRTCLAADEQVYSDPGVRQIIARKWIPVRVDRDERPDIDSRYQLVASAYTRGKTGLPVTAFLFPTGEAMWADTVIPLEDYEDHPGLRTLLLSNDVLWKSRFNEAKTNAQFIQLYFESEKAPVREPAVSPDLLSAIMDATITRADHAHGGFGAIPRITNPLNAELVLLAAHRRRDDGLRDLALAALRGAINGAGYDRIGGGFHLTARDEKWSVALWDKPLIVNAAYLHALVEAVRATGAGDLVVTASRTVDYILGTLQAPEGGFRSGQAPSADPKDDAAYYTWRVEEVKAAVTAEELQWGRTLFGFRDEGEILLGLPARFTLKNAIPLAEAAAAAGKTPADLEAIASRIVAALAAARGTHTPPPVLEARYLDSTSLAASALLQAAEAIDRNDAAVAALKAIDRILASNPALERGVPHRLGAPIGGSPGVGSPILGADHAYFGGALLDAFEFTAEPRYLEAAKKTAAALRTLFVDGESGGLMDVVERADAPGYLRLRRKSMLDALAPSPQGAAAGFFMRLAALAADPSLRDTASGALAWTGGHLLTIDPKCSSLGLAIDALLTPTARITIGGSDERARELLRASFRLYEPGRIIERRSDAAATLRVCVEDRCRDAITDAAGIQAAIAELRSRAGQRGGSVAAP